MSGEARKIFGVGLSKTGTTSLANALQILGFRTKDNMGVVRYSAGDLSSIDREVLEANDAFTDTPIPSFYRELDVAYPGSKFILTTRERAGWLKSCMKQFTQRFSEGQNEAQRQLFVDMYGTNVFESKQFGDGYDAFVGGVIEHFKGRPGSLLIMDIAGGDGWEKLCPFLGRQAPDVPFPRANVTEVRWVGIDEIVAVARSAGMELLRHYEGGVPSAAERRPGNDGVSWSGKRLISGIARSVRGEDRKAAAVRVAQLALVAGLKRLTPQIPIVSRSGTAPGFDERKQWNHLWLVDPLDGEDAFASGRSGFSVNVALIEDGRPIYGVVHAPASDITYYARAGKGAFRRASREEPVRLSGHREVATRGGDVEALPRPSAVTGEDDRPSSHALAMCELASGPLIRTTFPSSMEWHTAAAQVILTSVGMRVLEHASGRGLSYNKNHLSNGQLRVVWD